MANPYAENKFQIILAINVINFGLWTNVTKAACMYDIPKL